MAWPTAKHRRDTIVNVRLVTAAAGRLRASLRALRMKEPCVVEMSQLLATQARLRRAAEHLEDAEQAYESWRVAGTRAHDALLQIYRAVTPDTEYSSYGGDPMNVVQAVYDALESRGVA